MKYISILMSIFLFNGLILAQEPVLKENFDNRIIIASASAHDQVETFSVSWTLGKSLHILQLNGSQPTAEFPVEFSRDIRVYPNPAHDHVIIDARGERDASLRTVLFDLTDKPLIDRQMRNSRMQLSLIKLPSAMYILRIYDEKSRVVGTFKIIKN